MTSDRVSASNQTAQTRPSFVMRRWEDLDSILRHASQARTEGDTVRARALFARAIELNRNDPRGWSGIATVASSLDEAIISLAFALALDPDDLYVRNDLDTQVHYKIEESKAADAGVLVALGRTLAEVNQKPWAYRLLARATELDPKNVEAWLWRAGVAEAKQESILCLRKVLSLDPQNPQAQAGLHWAAANANRSTSAIPNAEQAALAFDAAQQALREGEQFRAYDLFRRATELNPRDESAWLWRGSTSPDIDEALMCMGQAIAINPNNQAARDAHWWLRVKKLRLKVRTPQLFPTTRFSMPRRAQTLAPLTATSRTRSVVLALAVIVISLIAILGMVWLRMVQ